MVEPVKIWTLKELIEQPAPKIYYLVRPLLPAGGVLLIAGDVKTFKSYLALNMGYQMAGGQKVLDNWDVACPLCVMYVEMEVGFYETRERGTQIHAACADLVGCENLHIISKDMRIQFDTPVGLALFEDAVKRVKPNVVIVDPIVEFHSQDENRAIEMKKMLFPVRKILYEAGASLILVHHTAKSSEFRPGNNPASVRGSYLAGMANTILNLSKPWKNQDNAVMIDFTLRSARAPNAMKFVFDELTGGLKHAP